MYLFLLTTLATILASCFCKPSQPWSDWTGSSKLTVQTSNGPITGHCAPQAPNVIEYLGVPYAQPPIGSLRFAPPVGYTGNEHYIASDWGFDCVNPPSRPYKDFPGETPQAERILTGNTNSTESEDCLTLNIWSKPTPEWYKSSKPVLVFFYGGRFTTGATNDSVFHGQYLADAENVVLVTVNYRINIFGFPGAPDYPQNAGLRDQRAAVEWLHLNIAAFGGDPEKITIFGQSAGAVGVDYWAYAYPKDPIAKGFIQESGNVFSFPLNNMSTTLKNWYNVSTELGCGSSGDTMACMRKQSWQDIKAAAGKLPGGFSGTPLRPIPAFYPVPDEETIFSDYLSLTNSGNFARLPHLLGNNNNEGASYSISAFGYGLNSTTFQLGQSFLNSSFVCPTRFEGIALTRYNVSRWVYRYMADWENIRLYPGSGAWHTSELYMIFGTSEDASGIPPSEDEKTISRLFQKAWAAFAKDPENGLSEVMGWPMFDADKDTLVRIADGNRPSVDFVSPSVYGDVCSTVVLGSLATGT